MEIAKSCSKKIAKRVSQGALVNQTPEGYEALQDSDAEDIKDSTASIIYVLKEV